MSPLDRWVTILARRVIPTTLIVVAMLAVVRKASTPVTNADAYFHLRFGHEFLHDGWVPWHPGHVTSFEHADWVPTQWLSQVLMALVEDVAGLAGIAWVSGLLYLTFVVALFWAARREAALLPAAALVPVALIACWTNLTTRPQVASFILVVITMAAWQRARLTTVAPWFLVPLTWLWAILHGMWPVGIAISLAAALGIVLDRRVDRRTTLGLFAVPVASLAVAGLTPVGPRLYSAVLLVNSRNDFFTEWAPLNFRTHQGIALLALLAFTTLVLVKLPGALWFDALMLLVALGFAVYSQRTAPVAAAMLVPLGAAAAERLLATREGPGGRELMGVVGVAALLLAGLAVAVPHTATQLKQPAWVDQELAHLPAGTPVLNSDMLFGSYLLWKYPRLDFVTYGYGDVYTDKELEARKELIDVSPGWDAFAHHTGATIAIDRPKSPMTNALRMLGWSVSHSAKDVVLLRAPSDWANRPPLSALTSVS